MATVKERINDIRATYRLSANKKEAIRILAQLYDCSPTDIAEIVGAEVAQTRHASNQWSDELKGKIVKMFEAGKTIQETAEETGLAKTAVKRFLQRYKNGQEEVDAV